MNRNGVYTMNENVNSNALTIIENKKRNQLQFDGNTVKNSKILKICLKLPETLTKSIEFIVFFTNRTQNELLTEFVVYQLESYLYDHNLVILSIVEKNGFLELIGHGRDEYFGYELQAIQESDTVPKTELIKWKSMNLELKLNKNIIEFIEKYCRLSNMSKAEFIALLIIDRLDCIRACPEMILDYMGNSDEFFKDLKEGIDNYYGKTIIQKEKDSEEV